jgi:hypothetical protein
MKTQKKIVAFALVALLAVALAEAVPRLMPPSKFMKQDRYHSAVVKVAGVTEDGRFKLTVLEELYGETPDGLILRASAGDDWIEVGKTYVMGHTEKPRRKSHRWNTDPAGPRVLGVPAVGLAAFENSEAMRDLVRAHPEDDPLTDADRLKAVLEQLESDHVLSRRFVMAELALDEELRALVGDDELAQLKETLESGTLEPVAHEYLLRASIPMIDSWGGDWLATSSRAVADEYGQELDLASPIPSLLVFAFRALEKTGAETDAELARKHVPSNNPGVGKAAFQALAALDPELAEEVAPEIVDQETIHPDTRRFVARFWATSAPEKGTR